MAQMSEPLAASAGPYPRMTYEEYLRADLPEHTEWVDGEVVPMMTVSERHNEMALYLKSLLVGYVQRTRLGRVFDEPFNMKIGPDLPGRSPDVFFLRSEHIERVRGNHIDGPADIVVEVISAGTEGVDRGAKFYEYERGGVPEYWLIDPDRETAEFYVLDAKGVYRAEALQAGAFRSRQLDGFELKVEWLWERPDMFEVLRELGVL